MPVRFSESRIDASERTSSGALKVAAYPTKPGVFTYRRADGSTVRELRHPDQVFHADSLASLEDVPVTLGHPSGLRVPSSAFGKLAVGHVRAGSVAQADGKVKANLVLSRQDAIEGAERRTHPELSCGYDCKIDPTPGVYEGERYDQAQIEIRYNHVAMLEPGKGRMGRECRLDAEGEEIPHTDEATEEPMKLTINGKTFEGAEAQAEVTKLCARADALEAQVKTMTETVARHDAEAAQVKRVALVEKARAVLGKDFAVSRKDAAGADVELTDREIRLAVIRRADSSFDDKGRDDGYVEARFDATLAVSSKATAVIEALNGEKPPTARADAADPNSPAAIAARNLEAARKRGASV